MKRSFIRWVGGKTRFIKLFKTLFKQLSPDATYIEPFIGSGIVFFNYDADNYLISDVNTELINCYKVLRNTALFNELLIELQLAKYKNERGSYNSCRDRYNLIKSDPKANLIEQVALFIYINHNCFNGLYRVNGSGEFNASFGEVYTIPFFPRVLPMLMCSHDKLVHRKVTILNNSYDKTLSFAKKGDFIYLDPPYYPINDTSFVSYSKEGFNESDHLNLIDWCDRLDKMGCYVMYSNSNVNFIVDHIKKLGDHWKIVELIRNTNSGGNEILVTNFI